MNLQWRTASPIPRLIGQARNSPQCVSTSDGMMTARTMPATIPGGSTWRKSCDLGTNVAVVPIASIQLVSPPEPVFSSFAISRANLAGRGEWREIKRGILAGGRVVLAVVVLVGPMTPVFGIVALGNGRLDAEPL